jgi:outer membrane receptor for ferric coprogen and ferric-rhodotorulic acid
LYDRVEVLRGADGLNAATGNPSATVNFIRKRPTYDFQASGDIAYGSWDTKRIDVDVSGPLNKAGTVAGRLVAVHEDGKYYIDRYKPSKDIVYGVVDANLTPTTLATLGFSYENNRSDGAQWGGLPLLDANGNQLSYGVGASMAPSWAYFNTQEERAFAELTQQLGQRWKWKTTAAFNDISSNAKIFYPNGALNPDGSGIESYTSWWKESNRQIVLDSNVSGKIDLFGRTHDLVFGASFSRSELSNPSGQGAERLRVAGRHLPGTGLWRRNRLHALPRCAPLGLCVVALESQRSCQSAARHQLHASGQQRRRERHALFATVGRLGAVCRPDRRSDEADHRVRQLHEDFQSAVPAE